MRRVSPSQIRVVIADDERPARLFLVALLRSFPQVAVVGQATNGAEAIQLIERERPDVALLDLHMPEVDGLGVVRLLKRSHLPLVIFVTAYDEYAVRAFDLNAVDYLTKPVSEVRLRESFRRVRERLDRTDLKDVATSHLREAVEACDQLAPPMRLERIPVRNKDVITLVPVAQIVSIVADGELLHLTTAGQERHTINYRLKDLEARLDPVKFIRLGRGTLANIDYIARVTPMPGGLFVVRMQNNDELEVSRIQSRLLRARLLHL
jgi:two-component system LytT family response regulator